MALLTPQQMSIGGLTPSYGAVNASDTIANVGVGGPLYLHVKNASGTQDIVTIVVPGTTYGVANPDPTVTVPITTGDKLIGPIPIGAVDPSTGLVTIQHSQTTSVTCALLAG